MFNTPILFIVFNRPQVTKRVFQVIREVKPKQLFVAADGPRTDRPNEKNTTDEVRRIVTDVDWNCELQTLFSTENLGCGLGPKTAIDWFFEKVDMGIVLEDDCLPNNSFFKYCECLLHYFRHDTRVMHISGNNFLFKNSFINSSYYYSKYTHNWGWATWRRAWKSYNFSIGDYHQYWEDICNHYHLSHDEIIYWDKMFSQLINGKSDVWDLQWLYSVWKSKGVAVLPQNNLVSNIGFTDQATHTYDSYSMLSNMKRKKVKIIDHPQKTAICHKADIISFDNVFIEAWRKKLSWRLTQILKRFIMMVAANNYILDLF